MRQLLSVKRTISLTSDICKQLYLDCGNYRVSPKKSSRYNSGVCLTSQRQGIERVWIVKKWWFDPALTSKARSWIPLGTFLGHPVEFYLLVSWFELLCTWSQKVGWCVNWFSVCRQTRRSWGFEIGGGGTSLLSGAENWRQAMHTRFAQFSIQSNLISRSLSLSLSHYQSSQTWLMRSNQFFTEEKYFPMELCPDFIWQYNNGSYLWAAFLDFFLPLILLF